MKKIFLYSIVALTVLTLDSCCQAFEEKFEQSAAERLNAASDLYSARLMAQPNGWAMQLYPTLEDEAPYGTGYLVLLHFNKDKSVLAAMDNSLTNYLYKSDTSAWQVITDDGPVLSFNTFNDVIHIFSYPEGGYATSTVIGQTHDIGVGLGGDYEFIIVDAPEDATYMMLKGKKRATYNLLTPIEQGVVYEDYLKDVMLFNNNKFPYPIKVTGESTSSDSTVIYSASDRLHIGSKVYTFEDANSGVPAIYPEGGDRVTQAIFNPFLITKRGNDYYLRFRDEFNENGVTAQELKYNAEKEIFVSTTNDSCYLEGGSAINQFVTSLNNGVKWQANANSSMSTAFNTRFNNIVNELNNASYSFTRFIFNYKEDKFWMTVFVKTKKGATANLEYKYNITTQDSNAVLTFDSYGTPAAETIFNTIPSLKDMKEFFEGTLTVSPATEAWNLSSLKLSKTQDDWFVINIDKTLNK